MRTPTDNHEPGAHAHSHAHLDQRRLLVVLGVTSAYLATELIGGYLTGSIVLLSDSGPMLTDPAALPNGLFPWGCVVFIWIEAYPRLLSSRPVSGLAVMAVALVGIGVNTFSAWMTSTDPPGGPRRGMAMRAVFVHVISDLVGSGGGLAP